MFKGNNLPLSECLGRNTVMKTYSHKTQQSKLYFFLINHKANYSHSCFRKRLQQLGTQSLQDYSMSE